MKFDFIRGTILGGWWIDCRYTDWRWTWLGRLLFVGDAITAGLKRTGRDKSASTAKTSEEPSYQERANHSGTSVPVDRTTE